MSYHECTEEEEDNINKIFKNFCNENGSLKSIHATKSFHMENISSSISFNSDISDNKLDKIIEYFIENELSVGFIQSFEVNEEKRGKGLGKKFMEEFEENVTKHTDVDFLLARFYNKQKEGFELEKFYNKYGFKSILLETGDLLMFNKGYDLIIDNVLELQKESAIKIKLLENEMDGHK